MAVPRRRFLATGIRAWLAAPFLGLAACGTDTPTEAPSAPEPSPLPPGQADLRRGFSDLRRHFVFEYYPWYGGPPDYEHWHYQGRNPPVDVGSMYMPRLGAYDVRSAAVLEQHARWINESGVGAIALSWWGRGSWEDQQVPLIMDVMAAHDVKVTFAMESYADDRGRRFADDVLFLLREYGEKRRFDAFLLVKDADGKQGPLFKGFRCILPQTTQDCRGRSYDVPDYTTDGEWRRQTDSLRDTLRSSFDRITLLADSLAFVRTPASGFDGIGIYDNFIAPEQYAGYASGASQAGLVFSFNVNPGYDQVEPRVIPQGPCPYEPRPFAPPTPSLDWSQAAGRELAARRSEQRIGDSFRATLAVQTDPALENVRRGFFLVYVNSFNEWHEGHAFEPMKDAADLSPAERAIGYHNPAQGDYRLRALAALLGPLVSGSGPS
jgi:Glycosyl hydrolase family 99